LSHKNDLAKEGEKRVSTELKGTQKTAGVPSKLEMNRALRKKVGGAIWNLRNSGKKSKVAVGGTYFRLNNGVK